MINEKDRICVLDCHPGSGKTSFAIQHINNLPEDVKIIFITPFLKECDRIISSCTNRDFYAPISKNNKTSKLISFEDLVENGRNIVSTHILFSRISNEILEKIKNNNYILILDEVMNVVDRINLYDENAKLTNDKKDVLMKQDIQGLLDSGIIKLRDDYSVIWASGEVTLNKYDIIKNLADRNSLYLIDNNLIVWVFPIEVFGEGIFDKIFILTYMFDYQIQAYYYNYFGLEYSKYIVKDNGDRNYEAFKVCDNLDHDKEWRRSIEKLIHVYDNEKLNKIGSYYRGINGSMMTYSLSKNWYDFATKNTIKLLNQNISNYLKNITKSRADQRMWTCFKKNESAFKSNKELSLKYWVELNARATNDYGNKNVLIYPINRYLNPFFDKFFSKKDVIINEDNYACSELIQWIFRSAIRNGKEIWIYIPSQRMRELLLNWLKG